MNLMHKTIKFCMVSSFVLWGLGLVKAEEIPMLKEQVESGKLPPMSERLPITPFVVDFEKERKSIGKYGGEIRMLMGKAKDIKQIPVYTYARLVGYDTDYSLQPDLVEKYEVKEGREFTFTLREGHKWSDGHPLTSEDFRYYIEDMATHEHLGRKGIPTAMLVNGKGPKFTVIDERRFQFSWDAANPAFLQALAAPAPLYLYRPAHYMKQFHADYADKETLDKMVAEAKTKDWGGLHTRKQRQRRPENPDLPTLQSWKNTTAPPSNRYVFERNPYFHRVDSKGQQLPYVDRLIVNVASKDVIAAKAGSGESDLQARYLRFDDVPFLKRGEETNKYKTHLWKNGKGSQIALFPNLNTSDEQWKKIIRDVRFRRALSLAINRNEINQSIYFGLASPSANTVLPESVLYKEEYAKKWINYDVDAANKLLDEMGLDKKDKKGIRLLPDGSLAEITIETAGESSEETDVLELISDHYKAIGIKIFVRSSQRDIFRRRIYSGETILSVFQGINNALPSPQMSPAELAPTGQPQLQWPKWGQYYETAEGAGEAIDMPQAKQQMDNYQNWLAATTIEEQEKLWHAMLENYVDQVFSIGIVNNSRQPLVVANDLKNIPEDGIYSWEPTAYFGIYKPDTFWYDR